MGTTDRHLEDQRAAKEAVLDLFAAATGIPITLYEFPNGVDGIVHIILSTQSRRCEGAHCTRIREHDGGSACVKDQIERARDVFRSAEPELRCCHAGMYNQVVPILDEDGKSRAVVSYGELLLIGGEYEQASAQQHKKALAKLQLPIIQANELDQLRLQAKRFTREQFESFSDVLRTTIRLLYALIDQDEQMRRKTDHLSHEIQTPIQDVLGKTENLLTLWPALNMDEARRQKAGLPLVTLEDLHRRLQGVRDAAIRLRTVAQTLTLGSYLTDYQFEEHSLLLMLLAAKSNYEAEAGIRHIDIEIPREAPNLECSREHLQLALNNLLHNAVKYSFAGSDPSDAESSGPEPRHRFVRIEVRAVGEEVKLTIANYGIGILPEEIRSGKIFEDGYQGKLRQGEYRTGSGKGLYFVTSIVERHHGTILVRSDPQTDSEPEPGDKAPYLTRVTVRLPRRQPREETPHVKNHRMGG